MNRTDVQSPETRSNPEKNRTPEEILKEPYARILVPEEDGTYTAEILEFRGCFAEGDTPGEAVRDLENAATSWIEAAIGQGQKIPPPMTVHEFSGRINLRLPRSIHKQAARFAEKENVSLNQFFTSAIAAGVGAEAFYERLIQRLQSSIFSVHLTLMNPEFNCGLLYPGGPMRYESTESSESQAIEWDENEKSLPRFDSLAEASTDG
ncbi:MAG: toxin-antitoxin system HicB family antitoxin [Pirellulaceae bacterium]